MTKRISSGSAFENDVGYSRIVVDGDYVFVSGTTGFDYHTMTISPDPGEQAEQCFRNVEEFLNEAGASIETLLRVLLIIPRREDLDAMLPVIRRYLQRARPTSTMIIAELMDERMKLEVEVTARLCDTATP
ncbi:MAG: RidA family protein [Spirochaetia bacterium]